MKQREIKFRIWDKEDNKFFKPIYEAYRGNLLDISISLSGDLLRRSLEHCSEHQSRFPDRYEVNQYTNLKDKNGKEIYEGDIVKFLHKLNPLLLKDEYSIVGYSYNKVEFIKGGFIGQPKMWDDEIASYFGKKGIYGFTPNELTNSSIEIVGNIYENENLIE